MTSQPHIRPFATPDIAAVAAMFQRRLRRTSVAPSQALRDYLDRLYISGPFADPATPSLVYERAGTVAGFIGVTAQPMQIDARPVSAAVCGALMVDDKASDPMAAARLLKTFMNGSQDLSLSETAGDATLAMWRQLRGSVLSQHSLDWLRVIRPGGLALETATRRLGAARLLAPLARLADRRMRRPDPRRATPRWAALPEDFRVAGGLAVEPLTPDAFADLVRAHTDGFALRRDWSQAALAQVMADIVHKSAYGALRIGAVRARGGAVVGGFAYHCRPGATARVLDILARPERAGPVLDCLLRDAAEHGAVAVRGRTNPALFNALLERRCLMFHHSASVIAGRDAALVARVISGEAAFNGLVGERWSRLVGDSFA